MLISNHLKLTFSDATLAAVVVGKAFFECQELDDKTLADLDVALGSIGTHLGRHELVICAMRSPPGTPRRVNGVVGILVAWADMEMPESFAYEDLRGAFNAAASLPWDELEALFPVPLRERVATQAITASLVVCGPPRAVRIALGVAAHRGDEDHDAEEELPLCSELEAVTPGLEVYGDEALEHAAGVVYGLEVLVAEPYELPAVVDFAPAAHAARVDGLGSLAPGARYFLLGA